MTNNSWKTSYERVNINELNLDLKNPRTNSGKIITKENVIKELLDEDVLGLAKSISKKGYAASVVLMVINENKSKIVVDGNRRTLAVKILNTPNLLSNYVPNAIKQNQLDELITWHNNRKEDIDSLTAVIYPSRELAEVEMSILHLDGEAVKKWKPLRQYRFFKRKLDENNFSISELSDSLGINTERIKKGLHTLLLYEYVLENIDLGKELNQIIIDDKGFKTDKFQKTIINEEGERFLGYSYLADKNIFDINDKDKFNNRLKLILEEIYDADSKYFKSAQYPTINRSNYFRTIEPKFLDTKSYRRLIKNQTKKGNINQSNIFTDDDSNEPSERSDRKPTGLFKPKEVPFKLKNSSLQKLYNELKDKNILQFPNAAHDLTRSFLECSLVVFLKHNKINRYDDILKVKRRNPKNLSLKDLLDYISNERHSPIKDRSIRLCAKHLISNDNKGYSIERMNMVNHNENWFSNEKDVREVWEKLEQLFKVILNPNSLK